MCLCVHRPPEFPRLDTGRSPASQVGTHLIQSRFDSFHKAIMVGNSLILLVFLLAVGNNDGLVPSSARHKDLFHNDRQVASHHVLKYQNSTSSVHSSSLSSPLHRFDREASQTKILDDVCILTIKGRRYNVTAYGRAHPGGAQILTKFHSKDATKAFEAAGHSAHAYSLLKDFCIDDNGEAEHGMSNPAFPVKRPLRSRIKSKLFTREDPIGIHKYLGLFCLVNFIGRFFQMYVLDPAAGFGSRGHLWFSIACLGPHAMLSLSSLIFHTVPRSRVVGKPMIWQEYRVHNIIFGMRSVLTTLTASLAIKFGNSPNVRLAATIVCSACVLFSSWGADMATEKLRSVETESTTATMPYWEGCSIQTQRRFKSFYAYCQFMATLACLAVGNPAWPFSVLLAIQMASLLMTLVRKGLLSAKGYHIGYTLSLLAPYLVGFRSMLYSGSYEFPAMLIVAFVMYQLRRKGVSKFKLWVPAILGRLLFGEQVFSTYHVW